MSRQNQIFLEIEEYQALIERLYQKIEELYFSPICNEEGDIVIYQDWEQTRH